MAMVVYLKQKNSTVVDDTWLPRRLVPSRSKVTGSSSWEQICKYKGNTVVKNDEELLHCC